VIFTRSVVRPEWARRSSHDWKDRPVTSAASAPPVGPRLELERLDQLDQLSRLSGERTVPQLWHENYWFRRHELAYLALAPRIVEAARADGGSGLVIEAGCGEGYGVQLLREAGVPRVAALDYDAATLIHARAAYPEIGGRAARANLAGLPLADGCAAAITSFQVIEHLWTPWQFLDECARVLTPGGLLVVTTPNRLTFSPGLGREQKPANPFHAREFDADELRELVDGPLEVTDVLGVRHGPRLTAWQARYGDPIAAQLALPPDRWPERISDLVRSITADDFVLAPMTSDPVSDLSDDAVLDLVLLARPRRGR
jgi:SAM-dependent methyltransferase